MVKVKICGLTSPKDAELACELGVDFLGVIVDVSVDTPREINFDRARKVLEAASEQVDTVAVTMPESWEDALKVSEEIGPDYLQIHSSLPKSQLRQIKREANSKIIGVSSIPQEPTNPDDLLSRAKETAQAADLLLLDSGGSSEGGTGKTHDWDVSAMICESLDTPVILAGGLNPTNVKEAIGRVNPFGVDVASGVEVKPGRKDPELMKKFIENVGG